MKLLWKKTFLLGTLSIAPIGLIAPMITHSNNNLKGNNNSQTEYQKEAVNSFKNIAKTASSWKWGTTVVSQKVLSDLFNVTFDHFILKNHAYTIAKKYFAFQIFNDPNNYFQTSKGKLLLKKTEASMNKSLRTWIKFNYFALLAQYIGKNYSIQASDLNTQLNFDKVFMSSFTDSEIKAFSGPNITRVFTTGVNDYITNQVTTKNIITTALIYWDPIIPVNEPVLINAKQTPAYITPDLYGATAHFFPNSVRLTSFSFGFEYVHNYLNSHKDASYWVGYNFGE